MSLNFGFNSNNSKSSGSFSGVDNTTQNTTFNQNGTTNSNQTSAPTNPDWVNNGASGIWTGAQHLGGADPYGYVAGANPLQTQAGAGAATLDLYPHAFNTGIDYASSLINNGKAPQTSAVQASPYISQYMSPYTDAVVNATMGDFDANAARTRSQQSLDMARSGAFGGSGAALNQSLTEGELARARATQDAGLRSAGFTQAVGAAQQDAGRAQGSNDLNAQLHGQMQDRRLTAGNDLAGLTTAAGANTRANIATQAATGDQLRQIQQAFATAPLELQSWLQQQFAGLPTNLFHGQTDTGTQTQTQQGTQDQIGTEVQSGTQSSKGSSSGFKFGF